jgi:carboxypeptidase C (cathepsin A)
MLSVTAIRAIGALGLVPLAAAQFVTTPTNFTTVTGFAGVPVRYKEVPTGICELDPSVKSFSGYADVAENEHIFFWFFEARNQDPTTAPLTVW